MRNDSDRNMSALLTRIMRQVSRMFDLNGQKKKHDICSCRALSFWYVIERFSSLLCSLYYYIQIWGISYNEDVYINWSSPSQDCSWGKQSAKV